MTKVLFVSNDPTIFDDASAARSRMRAYAAAIGELHIVGSAPSASKDSQEGNLFLHPVHAWKIFRVAALAKRARTLIAAHGIEVVSAQDPFEHGLAALRATRGTPAKLHIQVHTDFLSPWFVREGNWRSPSVRMPLLNRYRVNLAGKVLPAAHGIRVVSERVKESLVKRYGTRIPEPTVIPVFVDPVVPAALPLPARPFKFTLLAVGRLEPEKRVEDILAALKLVAAKYPMVGVCIAGDGRERRKLEAMVRHLELTDRVVFLGEVENARALMGSANVFIQSSAFEGYGRTLVEAALARLPIITTDVGIIGEVFRGYEDVLVAPVADPTALSLHIVGLIEDNTVRQELVNRAEERVRTHLAAVGDVPARIARDLELLTTHPS
jgi:glycosyltransferase involved in cell wall biosynthesis